MTAPFATAPHIAEIRRAVAAEFGVSVADLLSDRRARAVSLPRQVAYLLAREMTRHSLPMIGSRFGRDHTSVLHGIRRVECSSDLRDAIGRARQRARGLAERRLGAILTREPPQLELLLGVAGEPELAL